MNVGNLSSGYHALVPCTPLGCLYLIKKVEKNLSGKHAVIIGRSNLNGKPMAQLLLKENCTVTIVHSKTKDLKQECLKGRHTSCSSWSGQTSKRRLGKKKLNSY
jgi:methylenetetrahydrofolate dehydrogenase (NADP+)/methenyltetrahydrofolate cyclohydrolase